MSESSPRGFIRAVGGVGGAAVLSQLMALLATPIMSRLFSQAELGRYGLFFGLANVLVTLSLLGLTDAMLAAHSDADADVLLASCFYCVAITAPLLGVMTYVIIRLHLFGYGELPGWTAIPMVAEVATIGAIMTLQAWLIRRHRFRALAIGHVALGAMRSSGQVLAGIGRLGYGGLVAGEVATRAGLVAVLARPVRADIGRAVAYRLRDAARTVWRYRIFPIYRTPSTFVNNLGTALPQTLVAMIYGISVAGTYTLMATVVVAPSALVQRAVGDVFLGHFSEQFRRDPHGARKFLVRITAALVALAFVPATILFLWGPPMFALVFGEKWRASGTLASIMAPALIGELAIAPLGAVLNVVNRPDAKLLFDLSRMIGYGATYLIATSAGLPPTGMVALLARFSILSYSLYALLIFLGARYPRRVIGATAGLPAISG